MKLHKATRLFLYIIIFASLCKNALAQENLRAERSKNKGIQFGLMGALLGMVSLAGAFFYQGKKLKKLSEAIALEKNKSDTLLLNILPESIAAELKEKGEVKPRIINDASVIFTDFTGFTEMAAKMSAKELVEELHDCYSAFDEIISLYNIEKIKVIGDSYMAAALHGESAADAVNAAITMQQYIKNKKHSGSRMRVGIHTGQVVAGIVGTKKFQFDIWGDTVNTASRMESSGEPGAVNISDATYQLIKTNNAFSFIERGALSVKNKGVMKMYFVERR